MSASTTARAGSGPRRLCMGSTHANVGSPAPNVGLMKDKDLKRELWRKEDPITTLDKVLGAISASEAAIDNQSAMAGQASPARNASSVINWVTCQKTVLKKHLNQRNSSKLTVGSVEGQRDVL